MKLPVIKCLALLVCLTLPGTSLGDVEPRLALVNLYHETMQGDVESGFGVPIFVRSNVQDDHLSAEVYGLVEHSFTEVDSGLGSYANWCQLVPLSLNIKSCTWHSTGDQSWLTFYAGRKFYEKPEDAFQLQYNYEIISQQDDYVRIVLSADKGPLGTSDYRIELDAMPVGDRAAGSTFVRIISSYRSSFTSRLATDTYLATLGKHKVGFSVVGVTQSGGPIYVDGIQGVIERNAMRYYLALVAFFDASKLPHDARFESNRPFQAVIPFAVNDRYG
jgi:hypothetical protein